MCPATAPRRRLSPSCCASFSSGFCASTPTKTTSPRCCGPPRASWSISTGRSSPPGSKSTSPCSPGPSTSIPISCAIPSPPRCPCRCSWRMATPASCPARASPSACSSTPSGRWRRSPCRTTLPSTWHRTVFSRPCRAKPWRPGRTICSRPPPRRGMITRSSANGWVSMTMPKPPTTCRCSACCAAELREESPVSSGKILVAQQEGVYLLKLTGDVRVTLCASINDYIEKIFSGPPATAVYVDLLEAEGVDSTTLGLLAKLAVHCIDVLGIKAGLLCVNRNILRILESMELDELFVLLGMPASPELPLRDITPNAGDEPDHELVRRQVLEAHKLLV